MIPSWLKRLNLLTDLFFLLFGVFTLTSSELFTVISGNLTLDFCLFLNTRILFFLSLVVFLYPLLIGFKFVFIFLRETLFFRERAVSSLLGNILLFREVFLTLVLYPLRVVDILEDFLESVGSEGC